MAEEWGKKVAKWIKLTNAAEDKTADVVIRSDGKEALAVDTTGAETEGSTLQFSGSVGTVAEVFPDPAQTHITEFIVHCPEEQDVDNRLLISINGSDFLTLRPSGHWAWTPKGVSVTQITLKGNIVTGVLYQLVVNIQGV